MLYRKATDSILDFLLHKNVLIYFFTNSVSVTVRFLDSEDAYKQYSLKYSGGQPP